MLATSTQPYERGDVDRHPPRRSTGWSKNRGCGRPPPRRRSLPLCGFVASLMAQEPLFVSTHPFIGIRIPYRNSGTNPPKQRARWFEVCHWISQCVVRVSGRSPQQQHAATGGGASQVLTESGPRSVGLPGLGRRSVDHKSIDHKSTVKSKTASS